jgi:hypothetical protein
MERLTGVIGRFAKRVCALSLMPALCATFLLAACASGAASASPTERVPASARVLTVSVSYPIGSQPSGARPGRPVSATVTDLARVRQVAGLIDGLSLASPGTEWSCPAFTGALVNLVFRGSPSGRTVAAARFNMSGCGGLGLTVAGVEQTLITSSTTSGRILQIAGIRVPAIGAVAP